MRRALEFPFYLAVGVGMALSCSSFMMVAGLFQVTRLTWVLLALAIGALFCTVLALSIGELAGMYPSSPAIVTYFKAAFGSRAALFFVYLYLIFIVMIAGVESYLFALVMRKITHGLPPLVIVVLLLVVVVTVNVYGLELPRSIQMVLTFAAILLILALGALGAVEGGAGHAFAPGDLGSGLANFPAAVGLAVFLFMGFEWVTPIGLRPGAYARQIPLSMPLAILVLAVAYAVFSSGLGATVTRASLKDELIPQVAYFDSLAGRSGVYLAALLSLSAIVSTFNAGIMSASRLVFAVAREGHLPRFCATLRLETGAPIGAVLLLGGLGMSSAFVVVGLHVQLLAAVIGAAIICVIYAGYMAAVLRLKRTDADRARPFRNFLPAGLQRAVVALLLLISVATLFSLPHKWPQATAATVVAVVTAYLLSGWSVRRSPRSPRQTQPVAAARQPS